MEEELSSVYPEVEKPIFSNEAVDVSNIPTIATLEYSKLELAYRNVSLITTTVFFAIIAIVITILVYSGVENIIELSQIIYAVIALLWILSAILVYFGFQMKSYAVRERDLVYNEGLIWQSSTVIPFNRVQHCEISQGPIERLFKLSELKVFTAGGASSDMSVPGLLPETAERLKEFIIIKTGLDEEE